MLRVTDLQYWLHPTLKVNLDTLAYNILQGWAFTIIIAGDMKVRMGKSMLAQQIAYYLSYKLNRKFSIENVVFSGEALKEKAKSLSPAVFILDESRADLASAKTLRGTTQELLDFFSETGMLQNVVILVLPDFFELTKTLAVGNSEYLINCFRTFEETKDRDGEPVLKYVRGKYAFWGNTRKNRLYNEGFKHKNYLAVKPDFYGEWRKFWVLDVEEYEKRKTEFIHRNKVETPTGRAVVWKKRASIIMRYLYEKCDVTQEDIANLLCEHGDVQTRENITQILAKSKKLTISKM